MHKNVFIVFIRSFSAFDNDTCAATYRFPIKMKALKAANRKQYDY